MQSLCLPTINIYSSLVDTDSANCPVQKSLWFVGACGASKSVDGSSVSAHSFIPASIIVPATFFAAQRPLWSW